jgi:hypothetical protein
MVNSGSKEGPAELRKGPKPKVRPLIEAAGMQDVFESSAFVAREGPVDDLSLRLLQFEKHFHNHERGRVQRTGRTDGFRRDRSMSKSPRAINGNRNM